MDWIEMNNMILKSGRTFELLGPYGSYDEVEAVMRDTNTLRDMVMSCVLNDAPKKPLALVEEYSYRVSTLELILARMIENPGSDAWVSATVIECEMDAGYQQAKGPTSKRMFQISRDFAHDLSSFLC